MPQTAQHMPKQVKKYTHRKLNIQQSNENAEKIANNRNEYVYMLSIDTNAKITLYRMSKQGMHNKQKHVNY